MSRMPKSYLSAPETLLQLSLTDVLLVVGPGLALLPGEVLPGIFGTVVVVVGVGAAAVGVVKYSAGVKSEQPAVLQARTFHLYFLPACRLAV